MVFAFLMFKNVPWHYIPFGEKCQWLFRKAGEQAFAAQSLETGFEEETQRQLSAFERAGKREKEKIYFFAKKVLTNRISCVIMYLAVVSSATTGA